MRLTEVRASLRNSLTKLKDFQKRIQQNPPPWSKPYPFFPAANRLRRGSDHHHLSIFYRLRPSTPARMSSKSSRRKEHNNSFELSKSNPYEGTAARTRPLSFDVIMLRRKNKRLSVDAKDGEVSVSIKDFTDSSDTDCIESANTYRKNNDSYPSMLKDGPENSMKLSYRNKDERMSMEEKNSKHIAKDNYDSEKKRKVKLNVDLGQKPINERLEKQGHIKGKHDNCSTEDSQSGSEERQSRDFVGKDRYADRSRHKSESESRSKDRRGDEDTCRDIRSTKDHCSRKRHKSELSDRKGRRASPPHHKVFREGRRTSRNQEHHKNRKRSASSSPKGRHKSELSNRKGRRESPLSHYEESRAPRRRSRSLEHGKNRERRSASSSPNVRHKSEISERKGRRESPFSHREESRARRRRSRSQEHGKNRERRSVSSSPRAKTSTSYHGRDHADTTSHGVKEKPGRYNTDFEKSNVAGNGSNSHYRRHGGSISGLGGYSPRKRRSEAAVKTPSPIRRSPEKKSAGWDLPPLGSNNAVGIAVVYNVHPSHQPVVNSSANEHPSTVPVTSNAVVPPACAFSGSLLTKGASIDSIQLTQATRPMRRIYVENVPASASEKSLVECFNKFLLSSGSNHILGTEPCISCVIHKEKGHAVVEFLTPEDASAALSFNGRTFSGSMLKIRRPKDFVQSTTGVMEKSAASIDMPDNVVMDSPYKIFIGGISDALPSEKVMDIVSAFGPLKAYRFQVDDLNGPCAFLEYVDQSVTLKACAGLNGMILGGQVLTVVQALPNALAEGNAESRLFYGVPEHAKPLLEKPTEILNLKNVLNQETLLSVSEAELEEILEDIRLECARFGTIRSVNVVKHSHHAPMANSVGPSVSSERVQDDDKHTLAVSLGPVMDHSSGATDHLDPEVPSDVEEYNDRLDTVGVSNSVSDDQPPNVLQKEGQHESLQSDSMDAAVDPGPLKMPDAEVAGHMDDIIVKREFNDGDVADGSRSKNISMRTDCSDAEGMEANGKQIEASLTDGSSKMDAGGGRRHDVKYHVDFFFEPGSVLVEYKRKEASCMAAHCLHGRVFDDRIVTASYVAAETYRAKFPK